MITEKILIENASGSREHELCSLLAAQGKIIIDEPITSQTAVRFISLMQYMSMEGKNVTLYINSHGGEIEAGLAMYEAIRSYPHTLDICCVELAASMAALLLAAGEKGHRFILPNAKVLIHEPLIANGFGGSATNIEKTAKRILDVKKQMNTLLAKHTGKPLKEIDKATAYDNLMNAEEAIEFGICDEIGSIY